MADESKALERVNPKAELVRASGAEDLLAQIRREWQAKNLIDRVRRILPVDPSSACQRLLNAAIQDLRQKIVRAGLDVAKEAALLFKLPPVERAEDVLETYTTFNTISLAYRMGLLSRAEWRRLERAYDIRRDLEHEDAEYEANVEDILYIFKVSIEAVLSKDPVDLLRLSDVKELVDAPQPATPTTQFVADFEAAPDVRQLEILRFLIKAALDSGKADIVRSNAVEMIRAFEPSTKQGVKVQLGEEMQQKVSKKNLLELVVAKVAAAAGILPYLRRRSVADFFEWLHSRLEEVGHGWRQFAQHGKLLDDIEDIGGLVACPPDVRPKLVLWMTLCYLGEPGGYGWYGRNREVFYSNSAAPRIARMFKAAGVDIVGDFTEALDNKKVKAALGNKFIARRGDQLFDVIIGSAAGSE